MSKIYNKLVRDKIPEIIAEKGEVARTRILSTAEFKEKLIEKMAEEVSEVEESSLVFLKTPRSQVVRQNMLKELADLQEVLLAVYETFNISCEEVNRIRNKRKKERGAFKKHILLIES